MKSVIAKVDRAEKRLLNVTELLGETGRYKGFCYIFAI